MSDLFHYKENIAFFYSAREVFCHVREVLVRFSLASLVLRILWTWFMMSSLLSPHSFQLIIIFHYFIVLSSLPSPINCWSFGCLKCVGLNKNHVSVMVLMDSISGRGRVQLFSKFSMSKWARSTGACVIASIFIQVIRYWYCQGVGWYRGVGWVGNLNL